MSQDPTIKIIPAKVMPYENEPNTCFVSSTNESTSLRGIHLSLNGGKYFSKDQPITQGDVDIQYNLTSPSNSVLSTPNSYFSYTLQYVLNVPGYDPSATATTGQNQNQWFGKYVCRNNEIWFAQCTNVTKLSDVIQPEYALPINLCMAPMNSACIIKKSTLNYGGYLFEDDYAFRENVFPQIMLSQELQAQTSSTYLNQDVADTWHVEVIPFNITQADGNQSCGKKVYCSPKNDTWTVAQAGVKTPYKAPASGCLQPFQYVSTNLLKYTFYKTYIVPLNLLNQIFDTSNLFYISLLKGQCMQLDIKTVPYSFARVFGTDWLFDPNATGICDLDLMMYTKESEVVKSDMESRDSIIKLYKKYQYQRLPTQLITSEGDIFLTTTHKSVTDAIFGFFLQDDNKAFDCELMTSLYKGATVLNPFLAALRPAVSTNSPNAFADSTYIKQRYTLYSYWQMIAKQNRVTSSDENFVFFKNFNLYRGSQALEVFSRDFNNIDQMKYEILRSLNLLQQYTHTGSRCLYNITEYMSKYAVMWISLESLTMDTGEQQILYDGYYSKGKQLQVHYKVGVYVGDPFQGSDILEYSPINIQQNCAIEGSQYNVACIQYYDEKLKILPKATSNQMSQSEDLD